MGIEKKLTVPQKKALQRVADEKVAFSEFRVRFFDRDTKDTITPVKRLEALGLVRIWTRIGVSRHYVVVLTDEGRKALNGVS